MSPHPPLDDHACRVYWGHCGCDLYRGHPGPHIGFHLNEEGTEVTAAHVMGPGIAGYEHIFGEDAPDDVS